MTFHEQVMQFLAVMTGVFCVGAAVMLFGAGVGADVTALMARDRPTRANAAADLVLNGGTGLLLSHACRKWRKRKRRQQANRVRSTI